MAGARSVSFRKLDAEKRSVVENFQKLHAQKKDLIREITKVEDDMRVHKRVLDALRGLDESITCYRSIADTLVRYTVGDVKPALADTLKSLESVSASLKDQLKKKSQEFDEYCSANNIRFISSQNSSGKGLQKTKYVRN